MSIFQKAFKRKQEAKPKRASAVCYPPEVVAAQLLTVGGLLKNYPGMQAKSMLSLVKDEATFEGMKYQTLYLRTVAAKRLLDWMDANGLEIVRS